MKNLKQFCYGFGVGVTLTALTLYSPLNGDVMKEPPVHHACRNYTNEQGRQGRSIKEMGGGNSFYFR